MSIFVGREKHITELRSFFRDPARSRLTVIHGRKDIGKTRLVTEAYNNRKLLHFEGLRGAGTAQQKKHFGETLYRISGKPEHANLGSANWEKLLVLLAEYVRKEPCVVFFDEFPVMAAGRNELLTKIKYVWDNYFVKNGGVHLILSGSSTSAIVKKVISTPVLSGRVDRVIFLKPLTFGEVKKGFFGKVDVQDALEYYLVMGGIAKYMDLYDQGGTVRQNLAHLCFKPGCYFLNEPDRLFSYHFQESPHYRAITEFLAGRSFSGRNDIADELGIKSGGTMSNLLKSLNSAGFVEGSGSVHKPNYRKNKKFRLTDNFLSFYYSFMCHWSSRIQKNGHAVDLYQALPDKLYDKYLELAMKKFCYQHAEEIAEKMGFEDQKYEYGAWYEVDGVTSSTPIELVFRRDDKAVFLCDIKYRHRLHAGFDDDGEKSLEVLGRYYNQPIHRVLISAFPSSRLPSGNRAYHHVFSADSFG